MPRGKRGAFLWKDNMIKHVVCQKFVNKEDALTAAEMLRGLMGQVPSLKSMEAGVDVLGSERSFDLALIALFEDMEGLHAYDAHPAHQKVREFIKPRRSATVSVDFEWEP